MTTDTSPPLHIAVLAFPFGTHAAPLLALARRLAAVLPASTRFSFLSTPKSNATLSFSANIKPFNISDGVPAGEIAGNTHVAAGLFIRFAPENFKKGVKEAEEDSGLKISCLLTDAFIWFAGEMATEMGVPWVPYWTAGACSLSVHISTDLIRKTCTAERLDQNLDFLPGLSAVRVGDLPEGIIRGDLESPIAQMLHAMGLKLPSAAAVVINSFEELEPATTADLKSKLRKVLHVGPPPQPLPSSADDEGGCISWLDQRAAASVAYVSSGTVISPTAPEMLALAQALEEGKIPFLWSLRDHSRHLLPEGFEERTASFGKVVSWAPQLRVLAHDSVGVFVTHCGWNSVLESITGGVPMICRPFFGDQTLNSRMLQDTWRVGLRAEGGIFPKVGDALELILKWEDGKKMREKIKVLKESALKAVEPNGSSTENFHTLLEVIKTCK